MATLIIFDDGWERGERGGGGGRSGTFTLGRLISRTEISDDSHYSVMLRFISLLSQMRKTGSTG